MITNQQTPRNNLQFLSKILKPKMCLITRKLKDYDCKTIIINDSKEHGKMVTGCLKFTQSIYSWVETKKKLKMIS